MVLYVMGIPKNRCDDPGDYSSMTPNRRSAIQLSVSVERQSRDVQRLVDVSDLATLRIDWLSATLAKGYLHLIRCSRFTSKKPGVEILRMMHSPPTLRSFRCPGLINLTIGKHFGQLESVLRTLVWALFQAGHHDLFEVS